MTEPDPEPPAYESLAETVAAARACRLCEKHLPLGPRPVFRVSATARILIVGQAPGTRVHETGIPWNDPSGERLREWLDLDHEAFYDESRIAILPAGFCYPGRQPKGGDLPPRPECAPLWHPALLPFMPEIGLVVLAGMYAQKRYLGRARKATLTATVEAWREYGPRFLPTPHPSWRSANWIKRNPWFEAETVPELQRRVRELG